MTDIITKIQSLDLSNIPEPFKVTEWSTITDIKKFVSSKTALYEATKGDMKQLQEDELTEFYNAVVEFQKGTGKKKVSKKGK